MNHDEYWKFDVARKIPVAELGIEIDATDTAQFFDGLSLATGFPMPADTMKAE